MTTPEPRMKGRFNLYDTPDGGLHISYQEDYKGRTNDAGDPDDEPVQHVEIPGKILNMAKMLDQAGGKMNPAKMLGMLKDMF